MGPLWALYIIKKVNRFYLLAIFCKGADALAMVSNTFMVAGVLLLLESCRHNQNTKDCFHNDVIHKQYLSRKLMQFFLNVL